MESRMTDGLFWGFSKLGLEPPRRKCLASRYSDASSFASELQCCNAAQSVRVAIGALPHVGSVVLLCMEMSSRPDRFYRVLCCTALSRQTMQEECRPEPRGKSTVN